MPKSFWNPAELLPLSAEHWDEATLVSYFQSKKSVPELDAWLLNPERKGTLRAQFLLRSARMAHSYRVRATGVDLLFGVPLVAEAPTLAPDWRMLHAEMEAGLEFAVGGTVRMCATPIPSEKLHAVGPSTLHTWMTGLTTTPTANPSEKFPLGTPMLSEGAYVWVGALTMPTGADAVVEERFFRVNAETSRLCRPLLMRIAGLAEEQGSALRLFPPTALWNAMSLSRIVRARLALQNLANPEAWQLSWEPGLLRAASGEGSTLNFSFPEEVESDIAPLLQSFSAKKR